MARGGWLNSQERTWSMVLFEIMLMVKLKLKLFVYLFVFDFFGNAAKLYLISLL